MIYKLGQVEPEVQDMIVPLTFHYAANEALIIDQHQHELESVGVFLEAFGTNSYIVRCHPAWFPKGEEAERSASSPFGNQAGWQRTM